ncbi:MAG: hypothetical protein IPI67_30655 [Myxococcales bacterium]|nr:hypothetical protein [Myxococcales bacterium]
MTLRKPTSEAFRRLFWATPLALTLGATACFALPNTGPTPVSRAELYQSSEPEYDAFFKELHDVQMTVVAASNEQLAARRALATELGLDPRASMELITARFEKQLDELAKHGSSLHVEFIGLDEGASETDAVVTLSDASGSSKPTSLSKALEQIAKGSAKLALRVRAAAKTLEALKSKLPGLEGAVDERFRLLGPARTKETHRNLTDARITLPSLTSSLAIADENTLAMITLLKKATPAEKAAKAPAGKGAKSPATKPQPQKKPAGSGSGDYEP